MGLLREHDASGHDGKRCPFATQLLFGFCGGSSALSSLFALNAPIHFWVRLPADGSKAMDFEI
jgi:hypothetical protein